MTPEEPQSDQPEDTAVDAMANLLDPDGIMGGFDEAGERISFIEAAQLMGDIDARRVDVTEVDGVRVSTVFLPYLPDQTETAPSPTPYETLVQTAQGSTWVRRWPTRAAAIAGHDQVVAELRDPTSELAGLVAKDANAQ